MGSNLHSQGNSDTSSESDPKLLGMRGKVYKGPKAPVLPISGRTRAWHRVWASKPGSGSDLASCVTGEAPSFSRPQPLPGPGHGVFCPLRT